MSKKIDTVVIPIAGAGTRLLPATKAISKEMLPILNKPLIDYAVDEAKNAGINNFIFILNPYNKLLKVYFTRNFTLEKLLYKKKEFQLLNNIKKSYINKAQVNYIIQKEPLGLGHAILCAERVIKNRSFAVILPDDLITGKNCLKELIKQHSMNSGNIIASMKVKWNDVSKYGIISPESISKRRKLNKVKELIEKPTIKKAPSNLAVVGRYILDNSIFSYLQKTRKGLNGEIQLTDALSMSINKIPDYSYNFSGTRYDCGNLLGMFRAQLSLLLKRKSLSKETLGIIKNELKLMKTKI